MTMVNDKEKILNAESVTVKSEQKYPRELDVSGDFILPDSHSDIKRILYTCADIRPENIYCDDSKIEFEGALYCKVLFLNEEGRVRTINYTLDYSGESQIENADQNKQNSFAMPVLRSVFAKTLNPRKLQIKAKILPGINAFAQIKADPEMPSEINEEDYDGFEMLKEVLVCSSINTFSEKAIAVSDDIVIPKNQPVIKEVIFTEANVVLEKAICEEGRMAVSGNAYVNMIYTYEEDQEEKINFVKKQIPVSYSIENPDITNGCDAFAIAYTYNPTVLVSEDTDGEDRIAELDFTYDIYAVSFCDCKANVVVDMYSSEFSSENVVKNTNVVSSASVANGKISQKWVAKNKNSEQIKGSFVLPVIESVTYDEEKGKYILMGSAQINVISYTDNGAYSLLQGKDTFETELDLPNINGVDYIGNVYPLESNAVVSGEDIIVDYSVFYDIFGWKENQKDIVVSAILTESDAEEAVRSSITVYYPEQSETIWDIAKKFKVKRKSFIAANSELGFDEGSGAVIIPRRKKAKANK